MKGLSDEVEGMLEQMTERLVEVSGSTWAAHDVVLRFRAALLEHVNRGD